MKRETQLQAQALADGIQACLAALRQPKDAAAAAEKKLQARRKLNGQVSPQRRMLRIGMATESCIVGLTTLCGLLLAYGVWVCWRQGYPQVRLSDTQLQDEVES